MNHSVKRRAAAIRHALDTSEVKADPTTIYRYSITAAQWEAVRLLIDRGKGTPAHDTRFSELSLVIRALLEQIGFGSELPTGFLPNDPERILCSSWQEAAEGW
jgi:hypothetical protein